jgi:hypothetical protein
MKTNLHSKNTQGNIKRKVIEEYPCVSMSENELHLTTRDGVSKS